MIFPVSTGFMNPRRGYSRVMGVLLFVRTALPVDCLVAAPSAANAHAVSGIGLDSTNCSKNRRAVAASPTKVPCSRGSSSRCRRRVSMSRVTCPVQIAKALEGATSGRQYGQAHKALAERGIIGSAPRSCVAPMLSTSPIPHEDCNEHLAAVYAELRRRAHEAMKGLPPGQTIQPTALVHEAYAT